MLQQSTANDTVNTHPSQWPTTLCTHG